jgi:hypothetical protein
LKFRIRKFKKDDLPEINKIIQEGNKFVPPDFTSPLFIVRATVVDDLGKIVAFGALKIVPEAVIAINKELLMSERAEIVNEFFRVGCQAAKKKGLDEIDAFVSRDKGFVNFLLKRMDFVESGAEVLVKRL